MKPYYSTVTPVIFQNPDGPTPHQTPPVYMEILISRYTTFLYSSEVQLNYTAWKYSLAGTPHFFTHLKCNLITLHGNTH